MGWGTGNLGGGSGGLNFRIVGGTSEPSNPRENLIWVNTDVKITSWVFSADEPENPESGMVWISTGSSSIVAFNALKKNGIHVYPISAKQYIAGGSTSILGEALLGEMVLGSTTSTDPQWVNKTAKTYKNGVWVDWIVYLYNSGDECISVTGGWTSYKGGSKASMTKNDDSITLKGSSDNSITAMTSQKIDLTNFNKIEISVIDVKKSGTWNAKLRATEEQKNAPAAAAELALAFETGTQYLDVSSLTGSYYIALYLYGGNGMVLTFDKIRLE